MTTISDNEQRLRILQLEQDMNQLSQRFTDMSGQVARLAEAMNRHEYYGRDISQVRDAQSNAAQQLAVLGVEMAHVKERVTSTMTAFKEHDNVLRMLEPRVTTQETARKDMKAIRFVVITAALTLLTQGAFKLLGHNADWFRKLFGSD